MSNYEIAYLVIAMITLLWAMWEEAEDLAEVGILTWCVGVAIFWPLMLLAGTIMGLKLAYLNSDTFCRHKDIVWKYVPSDHPAEEEYQTGECQNCGKTFERDL